MRCILNIDMGLLQEPALFASDWLIVPSAVDYAATERLSEVLAIVMSLQDRGERCQLLAIIPTFYDRRTRASRDTLADLTANLGDAVWPPIHRATILRECAAEGVTIFEKAPESRTAGEYAGLAGKVLAYAKA